MVDRIGDQQGSRSVNTEKLVAAGLAASIRAIIHVIAFLITLVLFLALGLIINNRLSEQQRQHLSQIQQQALAATYALTPWEIARTFFQVLHAAPWVSELRAPPLTAVQLEDCLNPARSPFGGKECLAHCYGDDFNIRKGDFSSVPPERLCRLGCAVHGSVSFRGDVLVDCLAQCDDKSLGADSDYRTSACFVTCGKKLEIVCSTNEARYYYAHVSILELFTARPLLSFIETMREKYFSSSISTTIFILQLALGFSIPVLATLFFKKVSPEDSWVRTVEKIGEFLLVSGVGLIGFLYLMWFSIWIGAYLFGQILSIATYLGTLSAVAKVVIETSLGIQFHRPATRLAHAIVRSMFGSKYLYLKP
jgi:hypothetical protein